MSPCDVPYDGGNGTEKIYGGDGTNILTGGSGLDDIFGGGDGSHNYIFGRGSHDRLVGGSGGNFIEPADAGSPPPSGAGLASIEVKDSNNHPTFDGSINASGNAYSGDDRAIATGDGHGGAGYTFNGYGGFDWTFDNLGSGERLGGSATSTPVAVYVTWNVFGLHLTSSQWADYATYNVYDVVPNGGGTKLLTTGLPGSLGGPLVVNQVMTMPSGDSPVGGDRPWSLLGVWNVPVGHTVEVELTDGNGQPNRYLCIGDAMIHPIWPTVSFRGNLDGTGNFGAKDDYLAACKPVSLTAGSGGDNSGMWFQLTVGVENLYKQIANAQWSDWHAVLPYVAGLVFSYSSSGGTPIQPDSNGDIVDSELLSNTFSCAIKLLGDAEQSSDSAPVAVPAKAVGPNRAELIKRLKAQIAAIPPKLIRATFNREPILMPDSVDFALAWCFNDQANGLAWYQSVKSRKQVWTSGVADPSPVSEMRVEDLGIISGNEGSRATDYWETGPKDTAHVFNDQGALVCSEFADPNVDEVDYWCVGKWALYNGAQDITVDTTDAKGQPDPNPSPYTAALGRTPGYHSMVTKWYSIEGGAWKHYPGTGFKKPSLISAVHVNGKPLITGSVTYRSTVWRDKVSGKVHWVADLWVDDSQAEKDRGKLRKHKTFEGSVASE